MSAPIVHGGGITAAAAAFGGRPDSSAIWRTKVTAVISPMNESFSGM